MQISPCLDFGELRLKMITGTLDKKRRNQDAGREIAFVPIWAWTQADAGRAFSGGAIVGFLANDIPPAFFRKRDRHFGQGYKLDWMK